MLEFKMSDKTEDGAEEVTVEKNVIYRVQTFVDSEGRQITAQVPINGDETPKYNAVIGIPTPMGQMRLPIDFEEGMSLEECFESFEEVVEKEIEKLQEKAREENLIKTPDQMRDGGVII